MTETNPKPRIDITPTAVTKHFGSPSAFDSELFVYQLGLPMVPRLLDYQKPVWIKTQFIAGTPYLDNLQSFNPSLLAAAIKDFHLSTLFNNKCLCHFDNQPSNILTANNQYYLIDFSDSRWDHPEADITHLLLFWAADLPSDTFRTSVTTFLKTYTEHIPISTLHWQQCLESSMQAFDTRRAKYGKPSGRNSPVVIAGNRSLLTSFFI